ncbi:MAG: YdeI family protein [Gemmatimonadales bacterium]
MKPRFFSTSAEWRAWLLRYHASKDELLVGFYKRDSGRPSITWPESVDEALCFGWIDGIRRRIDEISYSIRFTPRRSTSIWSAVNIRRVEELTRLGRMHPAGHAAHGKRQEHRSAIYSYEQRRNAKLSREQERAFKAHADAWSFFQVQAPSYRKVATYWVTSAKREETRARRLATLIDVSAKRRRLDALNPGRS